MKSYSDEYWERMGEYIFLAHKQLLLISTPPGYEKITKSFQELNDHEKKLYIGIAILTLPVHDFAEGNPSDIPKATLLKSGSVDLTKSR